MKNRKGFTLVELLVTISIIGVLSAIGLVLYSTVLKQSRDSKRQSDLKSIQLALEQYVNDQGFYPAVSPSPLVFDGVHSLTSTTGNPSPPPTVKTYMNTIPSDSDSLKSYYYHPSGTSYELCAALDIVPSPAPTCSGSCGTGITCNFKVTPP